MGKRVIIDPVYTARLHFIGIVFYFKVCMCVWGEGGGLALSKNPDKDQKREILEIMKILIRGEVREERCVAFL